MSKEDISIPVTEIIQPDADVEDGEELSITPLPAPGTTVAEVDA